MAFSETCDVVVNNTYNTAGTSTRALVSTLTSAEVEALFTDGTQWHELRSLLKDQFEMRRCGIQRNTFYDWLMSSTKRGMGQFLVAEKVAGAPSLVRPFILASQQSVWNSEHWTVTLNLEKAAYDAQDVSLKPLTALSATAGAHAIRVNSPWGTTLHANYFLPGVFFHVVNRGSDGTFRLTQWQIVRAAANATNTFVDIEAFMTQQETNPVIPHDETAQSGMLLIGSNNVHDVERWCENMHNVNLTKSVPFWYQTIRYARRTSSEYRKFFTKMMSDNEWYAKFADLTIAQRNAQDEMRRQKQFIHTFLFGERYSDNQTIDLWPALPQILSVTGATVDPGTGNQLIAYRANLIGVLPQLAACNQFIDLAGQNLNMKTFLEVWIYNLVRARKSSGKTVRDIDVYTDETSAIEFMQAFIAYSDALVGPDKVRINIEQGSGPGEYGFPFRRYQLYKPAGVWINIITDPAFDDLISGSPAADQPVMKGLWILDLGSGGTIYPAIIGSNRKQFTTGRIEELARIDSTFACVMENPTFEVTLVSQTVTAVVECPLNSLVVANWAAMVTGIAAP